MAWCETEPRQLYARYYDSPDGCDVEKKAMVAARYGVIAGLWAGTADVLMYSHAVGFTQMFKRYAFHVVPLGLMGATFALVSNAMLRFRQKDDKLNYFVGGFATSPILAAYVGTPHVIIPAGVLLGIAGLLKKSSIQEGWCFFPDTQRHWCRVNSWRHDYTLVADPRDSMYHSCEDPFKNPGCDNA